VPDRRWVCWVGFLVDQELTLNVDPAVLAFEACGIRQVAHFGAILFRRPAAAGNLSFGFPHGLLHHRSLPSRDRGSGCSEEISGLVHCTHAMPMRAVLKSPATLAASSHRSGSLWKHPRAALGLASKAAIDFVRSHEIALLQS